MGTGRFSADDYDSYTRSTYAGKSLGDAFKARSIDSTLSPTHFKNGMREARDNDDNPQSTPIAIFCDVTGSMGHLAHEIVLNALPTIVTSIYDRRPVTDPQVLVGAIGDAYCDTAPIQASQFEADGVLVAEQLQKLYIEGRGGGNQGESYSLAHLFAAMQTSIDSFTKRGQKGFLFTIGDEPVLGVRGVTDGRDYYGAKDHTYGVTKDQAKRFMGLDLQDDMFADDIYALASAQWEIFHINVKIGTHSQKSWQQLIGQRLLPCSDINSLGEIITSAIQVTMGDDAKTVAASWGGDKSLVVAKAVGGLTPATTGAGAVARV